MSHQPSRKSAVLFILVVFHPFIDRSSILSFCYCCFSPFGFLEFVGMMMALFNLLYRFQVMCLLLNFFCWLFVVHVFNLNCSLKNYSYFLDCTSCEGRASIMNIIVASFMQVLLKMLPYYYRHVGEHENTLITKFFGLHRITLKGGRKVSDILSYGSCFHSVVQETCDYGFL